MGRYSKGMLGTINGKVGPVVGSTWRGVHYFRSKGPDTRNNNSDKQKVQQAKFGVAVRFVKRLKQVFKITFKSQAVKKTTNNYAVALTVNNAIAGVYPNFELDYTKVQISGGGLEKPLQATMTSLAGLINWAWSFNFRVDGDSATQRAVMVVYCPAR